jgi:hypothetical protein
MLKIFKVTSQQHLNNLLSDGLISLYQEIFSEPPYNEKFTPNDVETIFNDCMKNGTLLISHFNGEIIGFNAAISFVSSDLYGAKVIDSNSNGVIFNLHEQNIKERISEILPKEKILEFFPSEMTFLDCTENIWYVSDLGVKKDMRNQQIGCGMMHNLISCLPSKSVVLLRTSKSSTKAQNFYSDKCKFSHLNVEMEVLQERQDGTVNSDWRVVMFRFV